MLVDRRVQGPVVNVVNFFVTDRVMAETNGISSPSIERFAEIGLEVQVGDEGGHVGVFLLHLFPLAFPHFDDPVREGKQSCSFLVHQGTDIVHGLI